MYKYSSINVPKKLIKSKFTDKKAQYYKVSKERDFNSDIL